MKYNYTNKCQLVTVLWCSYYCRHKGVYCVPHVPDLPRRNSSERSTCAVLCTSAWWRVLCFVLSISWWTVSQNTRYCPSALSPTSPSPAKMMSPSPNRKLWFSSRSYIHYPGSLFFLPPHNLCSSTQHSSFSTLPWMKARLYLTGPL